MMIPITLIYCTARYYPIFNFRLYPLHRHHCPCHCPDQPYNQYDVWQHQRVSTPYLLDELEILEEANRKNVVVN